MNEQQAQERIDELKGFYAHAASFVAVNLFLITINLVTTPNSLWFIFPLFGWGIGFFIHAVDVFGTSADWEARKMQELTGITDTREELKRLSERTDNLVTILSSVNWENIDPDLVETRKNLEATKAKVVSMQREDLSGEASPHRSEDVVKEIEKLEAFVTSSRFNYLELAADTGDARTDRS